jgi:hypothetical protein
VKKFESDDETFNEDAYTVKGHRGIAWYVLGWEMEPGKSEWYDEDAGEWMFDEEPEPVRTGRVVAVMIGDDRHFAFDKDDIEPLAREAYCGECGQIGCTHDGLDRTEQE